MNKIFRVVWNDSIKEFIAVGEFSGAGGKGVRSVCNSTLSGSLIFMIALTASNSAHAGTLDSGTINNGVTTGQAIAYGPTATVSSTGGIAIGSGGTFGGTTTITNSDDAIAIGNGARASNAQAAVSLGASASATSGWNVAVGSNTSASGTSSTAVGGRSTASGTNSTALGYGASASMANSVALGANSLTDRANVVSVGSIAAGNRQIIYVADGTQNSDAATFGQLKNTAQSVATALGGGSTLSSTGTVTAPSYSVQGSSYSDVGSAFSSVNTAINNLNTGRAGLVLQDSSTQNITVASSTGGTSVNIAGTAGNRTLSGVAAGTLSSTSNQAVNGSQLFATNNQVQTNSTNITNLTNGTTGLVKQNASTQAITVASDKAGTSVNIAGTAGNRTLSGVAAGALNASSTDAVNGSQLFATNNQVQTNTNDISTNKTNITNLTNGTTGLVKQDATTQAITVASDKAGTSVNIAGTAGNRTLSGVAAGALNATSTQAVNGSQLFATNNQVQTNSTNITNLTNGTTGLVKQDATTQAITVASDKAGTSVNIAGTAGNRTLSGVAAGTLNSTSTQAVNGSQLFTTNNQVQTNTNDISTNKTNITNLTNGTTGLVKQDATTQAITVASDKAGTSVNIAGTAGNRTLSGVAAGALNATSNQAVNGSQLFATNNQVQTNTDNIAGNTSAITNLTNGTTGLVQQNSSTRDITVAAATDGTRVNFANVDGDSRTLAGVSAGALNADSTEAVNGSQLFATNNQVQTNTDDIATNTTNIAGNTSAITNLTNGTTGLVKQDPSTNAITVGADTAGTSVSLAGTEGSRTLAGVSAGALNADSTEAVNGSQLFATNNQVQTNTDNIATNTGDIATNKADIATNTTDIATNTRNLGDVAGALGGGAAIAPDGTFTAPSYDVQGNTYSTVGDALTTLDTATTGNSTAITTLQDQLDNGSVGLVQQNSSSRDITVAAATDGTRVNFANVDGDSRTLAGVSAGALNADSTEAVNGSQLFATNNQVQTNTDDIATNTTNIAGNTSAITNLTNGTTGLVKQDPSTNAITVGADTAGTSVSLAGTEGSRTLTGVSAGALNADSTEAVNGSQLFATNNQVQTNTDNIATNTGDIATNKADIATNTTDIATNTRNLGDVAGALGGGAAIAPDGTFTAPSYDVQGNTYSTVGDALTTLDTATTGNSTAITTLQDQLGNGSVGLVQQNSSSRDITVAAATDGTRVNFANVDGDSRTLAGVSAGALNADSTEAVNGSQLFATNNQVQTNTDNIATNTGDIATNKADIATNTTDIATNTRNLGDVAGALGGGAAIAPDGTFTAPSYDVQGNTYSTVGDALTTLDTATTGNSTAITTLQDQLGNGSVGLVQQNSSSRDITVAAATDGTRVNFANVDGDSRTLTGVSAGALNADSTEAVNGSQLFATNNQVQTNTDNIATNTGDIATNKADIATNTTDIATNTRNLGDVAGALGGGAAIAPDGTFTAPSYDVQGNTYSTVGDALTTLDTATTGNSTAITTLQDQLGNGSVGLVQQNSSTRDITVAAATDGTRVNFTNVDGDSRTLAGVSAGALSADSTEAVNGSQLFATNNQVQTNTDNIATNTGNIATNTTNIATNTRNLGDVATAMGGGAAIAPDGTFTAPSYDVQGNTYSTVGDALTTLDTATTGNSTAITTLQDQLGNGSVGLVQQNSSTRDITVAAATDGTRVNFANVDGDSRTLTGVSAGALNADSTDAVNGSQLFATNNQVQTNTDNIATNTGNIATNTTNIATNTRNLGDVAGALGGGAAIAPDGTFTAPSYDVQGNTYSSVGDALTTLDTATTGNSTAITTLQDQLGNGSVGLVQQNSSTRDITVAAATDGTRVNFANVDGDSRTLTGVSAGALNADSTEAVNGSQLFATNNQVQTNTDNIATNTGNIATNTTNIATNTRNLGDVAGALGGGAAIAPDGTFTAPSYDVQGNTYSSVGDALTTLDTATTGNSTAITTLQDQLGNGSVGLVQQNSSTRDITVAAATDGTRVNFANVDGDSRTLAGVSAGALNADSTEAVNGSQLFATNNQVQTNTDNIATNTRNLGDVATAMGGGAAIAPDGTFTAPSYDVQGNTYSSVGDALTTLDTATTGNSTAITTLQDQLDNGSVGLVQQNSSTRDITVAAATDGTRVNFANVDGDSRTLTGVSAGALNADSTEAVNGSQLFATNNQVQTNTDNIATNTGNIATNTTDIATNTRNLGDVATAMGGGAAIAPDGTFTAPSYDVQGNTYSSVGDALTTLDTATTGNSTAITTLQDQLDNGSVGLVQQNSSTRDITVAAATDGTRVNFANVDGDSRTLTGVSAGALNADSTDAVNGSQLYASNSALASALGGGSVVDANGNVTQPSYSVQGSSYNNLGDALTTLDTATTDNMTEISNIQNQLSTGEIGLVRQDQASRTITVASQTDGTLVDFTNSNGATRTLAGVSPGAINSSSTEAINGSQLYAANVALTDLLGGGASVDSNGNISGPHYTVSGNAVTNIGDALESLNSSMTSVYENLTALASNNLVTQTGEQNEVNIAKTTGGREINVAGKDGNRVISGVADGVNDNDAATISQLNVLSKEIANANKQLAINVDENAEKAQATGKNSIALGGNSQSTAENATAIGNGAVSSGTGGTALGTRATASGAGSLAMGGSSTASGTRSVAIGSDSMATHSNSVALGSRSVTDRADSVSVGYTGGERQITHVAPGTQDTDAVNMGQLKGVQANSNAAFRSLGKHIDHVEDKLSAGIASSMAMAGIPQAYQPDSSFVGAAVSGYSDKSAIAVGVSRISANGKWITKLQASANNESDFGASVGVGFQW